MTKKKNKLEHKNEGKKIRFLIFFFLILILIEQKKNFHSSLIFFHSILISNILIFT